MFGERIIGAIASILILRLMNNIKLTIASIACSPKATPDFNVLYYTYMKED